MPKAKVKKINERKKQNELKEIFVFEREKTKILIEKEAKKELSKTLLNRGQTIENGFETAHLKTEFLNKSLTEFNFKIFVVDIYTQKPHRVWHFINGGTKSRVLKKAISFRDRLENRTTPDDMYAKPFAGYNYNSYQDEWVFVPKGKRVKGVKARNWYKNTLNHLMKYYYSNLYKAKNWTYKNE